MFFRWLHRTEQRPFKLEACQHRLFSLCEPICEGLLMANACKENFDAIQMGLNGDLLERHSVTNAKCVSPLYII